MKLPTPGPSFRFELLKGHILHRQGDEGAPPKKGPFSIVLPWEKGESVMERFCWPDEKYIFPTSWGGGRLLGLILARVCAHLFEEKDP